VSRFKLVARALIVHAKDDAARQWYIDWEFESGPTDPFHLFLMLKDLKAIVEKNHQPPAELVI